MSPLKISHYRLEWDTRENMGSVTLVSFGGVSTEIEIIGLRVHEYMAVVDMLRNEKPVFYDPSTEVLSTGPEMVGEAEM